MEAHAHPNYVAIWVWLLILALFSVMITAVPMPHPLMVTVVFVVAAVKAILVALYYMHLRFEQLLIYSLALAPLICLAVLLLVLLPDIVYHP
ncbi:MAG: hypothetical protein KatS3mg131_1417 [Candidatus Tectimicrobiota bacterium]|nr:MAG: hypothetical protein KatS3mg131_1417 [Candidatus Tectomicrobia bacterium]